MRRTTLGPLSSMDLNTSSLDSSMMSIGGIDANRKSLASSGMNKMIFNRPRTQMNNRQSIATANLNPDQQRASFHIGRPLIGKKEVDPRPVTSSAFKNRAMEMVELFMIEHAYGQGISAQKLTNPTVRDFQNMVNFLLRQLDSSFHIQGKMEDDITLVAKALHYPFLPSKTALIAVGAPTTWPALLGMLQWLVELIRYGEEISVGQDSGMDSNSPDYFWWFIKQAYTQYLSGDDDGVANLEAEIEDAFQTEMLSVSASVEAEERRLASLEAQLQALESSHTALPRMRQDIQELEQDIALGARSRIEMEEYTSGLQSKRQTASRERATAQAELDRLKEEESRLLERVEKQELKVTDLQRLEVSKETLRSRRLLLSSQRVELDQALQTAESELQTRLDGLHVHIRKYHDAARALQMLPSTGRWAGGRDHSVQLTPAVLQREELRHAASLDVRATAHALLGCVDFRAGQKEWIRLIQTRIVRATEEARLSSGRLQQACLDAKQRLEELDVEITRTLETVSELEAARKRSFEAAEAKLATGRAELQRLMATRDERARALASSESSIRELSGTVLTELRISVESARDQLKEERRALRDCASRLALAAAEHVQRVRERLDAACAAVITGRNRIIAHNNNLNKSLMMGVNHNNTLNASALNLSMGLGMGMSMNMGNINRHQFMANSNTTNAAALHNIMNLNASMNASINNFNSSVAGKATNTQNNQLSVSMLMPSPTKINTDVLDKHTESIIEAKEPPTMTFNSNGFKTVTNAWGAPSENAPFSAPTLNLNNASEGVMKTPGRKKRNGTISSVDKSLSFMSPEVERVTRSSRKSIPLPEF